MEKMPVLKQHTPIKPWRNISEHVGMGDIVYITKPIEKEAFRFRLTRKHFLTEWESQPGNYEAVEERCLQVLENDEWSNQFVGYAYEGDEGIVLYSIYDLTFQVYLDGVTVQKIAEAFGFEKHPILYHGSVKPKEHQSVGDFLTEVIMEKNRRYGGTDTTKHVIVENVSRIYQYRRIIGKWSFVISKKSLNSKEPLDNVI